jgi:hypothetical protein
MKYALEEIPMYGHFMSYISVGMIEKIRNNWFGFFGLGKWRKRELQ